MKIVSELIKQGIIIRTRFSHQQIHWEISCVKTWGSDYLSVVITFISLAFTHGSKHRLKKNWDRIVHHAGNLSLLSIWLTKMIQILELIGLLKWDAITMSVTTMLSWDFNKMHQFKMIIYRAKKSQTITKKPISSSSKENWDSKKLFPGIPKLDSQVQQVQ